MYRNRSILFLAFFLSTLSSLSAKPFLFDREVPIFQLDPSGNHSLPYYLEIATDPSFEEPLLTFPLTIPVPKLFILDLASANLLKKETLYYARCTSFMGKEVPLDPPLFTLTKPFYTFFHFPLLEDNRDIPSWPTRVGQDNLPIFSDQTSEQSEELVSEVEIPFGWFKSQLPLLTADPASLLTNALSAKITVDSLLRAFIRPAHVPEEIWNQVSPYFIPPEHPLVKKLNKIFTKVHVLESVKTLKRAGFNKSIARRRGLRVLKHRQLKGHLLKAYLDPSPVAEWPMWVQRIQGAQHIQDSLTRHQFELLFKVPKKWIYPVPAYPAPKVTSPFRKNFVLVVEDMKIVSKAESVYSYLYKVDKRRMRALYIVMIENSLFDSIFYHNVPFSKDGRIAFIDTEWWGLRVPNLMRMIHWFHPRLRPYWEWLIQHGADVPFPG